MDFKTALKKLKNSSEFRKWISKNKKSYLTYAFTMIENSEKSEWQIGYYDKSLDKVTVFTINNNIEINPEQDVFKKPGTAVKKINLKDVKFGLDKVLKKTQNIKEKKYSKELVTKTIAILQNIDLGQLWNITLITSSLNTINIKIDAKTGKTIKHELVSLFQFRAG
ncbi:MAG: hypothetical protein KKE93_02955 [Nanoarchaeota archaeon]|nr:hypothetical protein [Nanoarchaeota archaeon]